MILQSTDSKGLNTYFESVETGLKLIKISAVIFGSEKVKGKIELVQRGQQCDPIDVLLESVQLKPKLGNMSDCANYSEHWLLTAG